MSFTDDQVCRRRFAECCYGKAISRAGAAAAVADGVGKRLRGQRQHEYLDALLEAFSLSVTYPLEGFDVIHASPPCQRFCDLHGMHNAKEHPDLLGPTRERLKASGLPYIIENVEGAPMQDFIVLCGSAFGLRFEDAELRRHRLFEVVPPIPFVPPCAHRHGARVIGVYGGHGRDRRRRANTQNFSTEARREAMGIDWMTGAELSQAIPPAYTEYIGRELMKMLVKQEEVATMARQGDDRDAQLPPRGRSAPKPETKV